jgi:hypothetical protein
MGSIHKHLTTTLLVVLGIIIGSTLSTMVAIAWGPPVGTPSAANNVAAPINVGTGSQLKNGTLGINNVAVFGTTQLAGDGSGTTYLNFGSATGSTGYGIRDNGGLLQFKISATNVWADLLTLLANNGITTNGTGKVSQLAFADGTNMTTGGGGGGAPIDYQAYTTAGTYTWTKPASGSMVKVECWGAGGGGGGSNSNYGSTVTLAGGGAGGGYAYAWYPMSTLTSTVAVTVGAGGVGGAASGGNGGTGDTSSFGSYLTATGGSGGGGYVARNGGGAAGTPGGTGSGTNVIFYQGYSGKSVSEGGYGATSLFSNTGAGVPPSNGGVGGTGVTVGAGGSGGHPMTFGQSYAGGVGAAGACVVTVY